VVLTPSMKRLLILSTCLLALASCSKSPTEAVADINNGATITGLITVSPELQSKPEPTDVLFIIARKDVGPPLDFRCGPVIPIPLR
jgi:hypothetical protein